MRKLSVDAKTLEMKTIVRATTVPQSLDSFCGGVLKELSKKYEVIAVSSPGPEMQIIREREGVRAIEVPMERRISIVKDCKSLWRMVCVFHREKPYMVHSMTPKAGLICMVAGWLNGVTVRIHTFTGLVWPTSSGWKRRILMLTDKLTCACATHIIPEGEGVKNDLVAGKITKKPLKVLGYGNVMGVNMNRFSLRPEIIELSRGLKDAGLFTFVFVGRIVADKGINELCEAFNHLHSDYSNTRLWLIGCFEDELDPISSMARGIIESPNNGVEAVGVKRNDELIAYYAAADCFVMPSYREGFPNTVLEAGAMGLPSIVTDINGSREIIVDGENGTIVPSKDVQALYDSMLRVLNDKEWREKMASNARRMIAERFEQGFVRKCLYEYYDEILGE